MSNFYDSWKYWFRVSSESGLGLPKKSLLILSFLFSGSVAMAQNNVGIGTDKPNPNAILDIVSKDGTKGLLIPRFTTAQREALVSKLEEKDNGLLVYDTDTKNFYNWNHTQTAWLMIVDKLTLDALELSLGRDIEKKADVLDVYKKTEIDSKLNDKANSDEVYTQAVIDAKLNGKANSDEVYTQAVIDAKLNDKANSDEVYTQAVIDAKLNDKANSDEVYTKTQLDDKLNDRAKQSEFLTLKGKVTTNEGDIADLKNEKADASVLYAKLTSDSTAIHTLANSKADTSALNRLDERVGVNETAITNLGNDKADSTLIYKLANSKADSALIYKLANSKADSTLIYKLANSKADSALIYKLVNSKADSALIYKLAESKADSALIYKLANSKADSTLIYKLANSKADSALIYKLAESKADSALIYKLANSKADSALIYKLAESKADSALIYKLANSKADSTLIYKLANSKADSINVYNALDNKLTKTLATNKIFVGSADTATAVDLSGDAKIISTGELTIVKDAITSDKIKNKEVSLDKISPNTDVSNKTYLVTKTDGTVVWETVSSGDITLADDAVESKHIKNGEVKTIDLANKAVTVSKINASTTDKQVLQTNGTDVVWATLPADKDEQDLKSVLGKGTDADGKRITNLGAPTDNKDAVTKKYVDDATKEQLTTALASENILVGDGFGKSKAVKISGDATLSNTGALTIANDSIKSENILDGEVKTHDLASKAVTLGKISPNTDVSKQTYLVTKTDGTVVWETVSSGDITLADDAVESKHIKNGEVKTIDLANKAVTVSKINASTTDKQVLQTNGTDVVWATLPADKDEQDLKSVLGKGTDADGKRITNLGAPTDNKDAVTKKYVDDATKEQLTTALASENILVGDGFGKSKAVKISGDATLSNTGALTIANDAVTVSKINASTTDKQVLQTNGTDVVWATLPADKDEQDLKSVLGKGTDADGNKITNLGVPTVDADAATKKYVDDATKDQLTTALASENILVGDGFGKSKAVKISGDATLSNTGALTIANDAVTVSKINASATNGQVLQTNGTDVVWATLTDKDEQDLKSVLGKGTDADGNKITNLGVPTVDADAATKKYVDDATKEQLTTALASENILVGDGFGKSKAVKISGDATLSNTGTLTIANDAVTVSKINASTTDKQVLQTNGTDVVWATLPADKDEQDLKSVLGKGTDADGKTITNLGAPTDDTDASTKKYVDDATKEQLTTALASENILVGDGFGKSKAVKISGDATLSNTGALTIANDAVTVSKINASTTDKQVLQTNGSDVVWATLPADKDEQDLKSVLGKGTDADGKTITNLGAPTDDTDASTKKYVDDATKEQLTTALASKNILVGDVSGEAQAVEISGDATLSNTGALTISNNAVTSAKIVDNTITKDDIASGAVEANELAADAVTNTKLADNAVDVAEIKASGLPTTDGNKKYLTVTKSATGADTLSWEAVSGGGGSVSPDTDGNIVLESPSTGDDVNDDGVQIKAPDSWFHVKAKQIKIQNQGASPNWFELFSTENLRLFSNEDMYVFANSSIDGSTPSVKGTEKSIVFNSKNLKYDKSNEKWNISGKTIDLNSDVINLNANSGELNLYSNSNLNFKSSGIAKFSTSNLISTASSFKINGSSGNKIEVNANVNFEAGSSTVKTYAKHILMQTDDDFKLERTTSTATDRELIEFKENEITLNATTDGTVTVKGQNFKFGTNNVTHSSDRRLKQNISTLSDALATVMKLRGTSYEWKSSGKKALGVIAQEVEAVLPELVHTDDKGMKSVAYTELIPVLLEAIKEQQLLIQKLTADVATGKASVKALTEALALQQKTIDSLNDRLTALEKK